MPVKRKSSVYSIWIVAILLSALINVTLFGLMPWLIHQAPGMPDVLDSVSGDIFQVIRVKQPESPPEKREFKPPEPKPLQSRRMPPETVAKTVAPQPVRLKPKLPFELNPSLPKLSTSLAMPPLEHFSMDVDAPPAVQPLQTLAPILPVPSSEPGILPMKSQYGMGDLDASLIPLVKIPPVYPLRAMRRGIEGWVKVRFEVDRQGRIHDPEVVEAAPAKLFDASVLKCVKQWKFRPGTVQGVPVNTLVETTIRFQLEK